MKKNEGMTRRGFITKTGATVAGAVLVNPALSGRQWLIISAFWLDAELFRILRNRLGYVKDTRALQNFYFSIVPTFCTRRSGAGTTLSAGIYVRR